MAASYLRGKEIGATDYGTSTSTTIKSISTSSCNKIEQKAITPPTFTHVCTVQQNLHYYKQ